MRETPKPAVPLSGATGKIGLTSMTLQHRNMTGIMLVALGAVLLILSSIWLAWESRRFEPVIVAARDIPAGTQITADDLAVADLPAQRPDALRGFSDSAALLGSYATTTIIANTVITPRMVQTTPPTQITFPNGRVLADHLVAVPIAIESVGPVTDHDTLNIGFISNRPEYCDRAQATNPTTATRPPVVVVDPLQSTEQQPRYACRWASSLPVLYVDPKAQTAFVAMTPPQSLAYQSLRAAGVELWFERYGAGSAPLQFLDRRYPNQVTLAELTDPVEETLRVEPRKVTPQESTP